MLIFDSVLYLVLFLIACIALAFVQVWLVRSKSAWPGFMLPLASFFLSLAWFLRAMSISIHTPGGAGMALNSLLSFLVLNISTVVFLVIFFVHHRPARKQHSSPQMRIENVSTKEA